MKNLKELAVVMGTVVSVCALAFVVALTRPARDTKACEVPTWLVLNYADGGPAILRSSEVSIVVGTELAGQPSTKKATQIIVQTGGFVNVDHEVKDVARMLCLGDK